MEQDDCCLYFSAKDMKEKFSMLRFYGDSSPPTSKDTKSASTSSTSTVKETKPPKLTAEMVVSWSKSFDSLLADKCMSTLRVVASTFLKRFCFSLSHINVQIVGMIS